MQKPALSLVSKRSGWRIHRAPPNAEPGKFSCIGNPLAAGMEQEACVTLIRFNDSEIRKAGRCFLP